MIGYEFEFLVREGGRMLSKEKFMQFQGLLQKDGWMPFHDPDTRSLLGSIKDGVRITTDSSIGIMEINLPPTEDIHASDKHMHDTVLYVQDLYEQIDCTILGVGVYPGRFELHEYKCLDKCLHPDVCGLSFINYVVPQRFHEYHHADFVMAAHQIWLDIPKNNAVRQLRIFNRLTPYLTALFASGAVFNGSDLGVLEGREKLWSEMLIHVPGLEDIYGMYRVEPETLFDYFDFILDHQFFFSYRHNGIAFKLKDSSLTYRDFLHSDSSDALYGSGGEFVAKPEIGDFFQLQHATYPSVRLKFFIKETATLHDILHAYSDRDEPAFLDCFSKFCAEVRAISAQSEHELSAGPALLLGLQQKIDELEEILSGSYEAHQERLVLAAERGLSDGNLLQIIGRLYEAAEAGLRERGRGEEKYLEPLKKRMSSKKNPAQEELDLWRAGGLAAIYDARDFQ